MSSSTRERPFLLEAVWYSPHSRSVYHHETIDVDARSLEEAEAKAYAVLLMHRKSTQVLGERVGFRQVGKRHRWADGYEPAKKPILRANPNLAEPVLIENPKRRARRRVRAGGGRKRSSGKPVCWGTDAQHAHHVSGCRPGRPLCKFRRMERENRRVCHCGAYHFPHRYGSGRCGDAEWMEMFVHGPARPSVAYPQAPADADPDDFAAWYQGARERENPGADHGIDWELWTRVGLVGAVGFLIWAATRSPIAPPAPGSVQGAPPPELPGGA